MDWLRDQGHEADHVLLIGLKATLDETIARHVVSHQAVIVTKDQDFVRHARQRDGLRVIHLRVGNLSSTALIFHCEKLWPGVLKAFSEGEPVVVVRYDPPAS